MDDHASFGYWVQRRRKALDLTQHDLARLVGCAISTIRKIEADDRRPSRQMAELLADKLSIPAADRATFVEVARAERAVDQLGKPPQPPILAPPKRLPQRPADAEVSQPVSPRYPGGSVEQPQELARPLPHDPALGVALEEELSTTNVSVEFDSDPPRSHAFSRFGRNRLKMLEKVNSWWVKGVLEQSLHGAALIALGISYEAEAVRHPWGVVLMEPNQGERSLPAGTNIIKVFDLLGEELLILGEPGAGKTTLLLELTRDLVARAQRDETHPIPVIFNLSSWSAKQSIAKWLVDELSTKYQVPRRIGGAWVDAGGVLLPLLDGLDEVREDQREACVDAINTFRHENGLDGIAICSRTAEYRLLTTRLELQGAVRIQPLTPQQISAYLASLPESLSHLHELLQTHAALQELVQSPLMLTIMTLAYQERTPRTAAPLNIHDQQAELLSTYIERMIQHRHLARLYPSEHIKHWLSWLAYNLVQRDQTLFLIERMDSSWLPTRAQRWLHTLAEGTAVGMIAGTGTALVYGLRSFLPNAPHQGIGNMVLAYAEFSKRLPNTGFSTLTPALWIVMILALGLSVGFISGLTAGILSVPIEISSIPFMNNLAPRVRRALRTFIHMGLAGGGAAGLIAWLFVGPAGILFELTGVGVISGVAATVAVQPGTLTVVETLGWSWRRAFLGLVISSFMALTWFLTNQMINAWDSAVYRSGERVIVYTVALGLAAGITSGEVEIKARANQGIWRSARNAAIIGSLAWFGVGLIGGLIHTAITDPVLRIISGVEFGFAAGIVMALGWGGFVCLQHLVLRRMLRRSGYIPRSYVQFLDAAVDSLLLRRVGGGYIFVHRLVMEHFANSKRTDARPSISKE